MASRSTRNKIKHQLTSAFADLEKAQTHLVQAAALGQGQSKFLENNLAEFIASLEMLIRLVSEFEARV